MLRAQPGGWGGATYYEICEYFANYSRSNARGQGILVFDAHSDPGGTRQGRYTLPPVTPWPPPPPPPRHT